MSHLLAKSGVGGGGSGGPKAAAKEHQVMVSGGGSSIGGGSGSSSRETGLRYPTNGKTIYHRPLNRSKTAELSQASFAYLFSEMVSYAQRRVTGIQDLEKRFVNPHLCVVPLFLCWDKRSCGMRLERNGLQHPG